jgi:uncharacterized membrane protein YciS (DUF1049 family)
MIAFVIFIGLLVVAALFVIGFVVAFIVASVKYRKGTLTKDELEANDKKVRNYFRQKKEAWKKQPLWIDEH